MQNHFFIWECMLHFFGRVFRYLRSTVLCTFSWEKAKILIIRLYFYNKFFDVYTLKSEEQKANIRTTNKDHVRINT